VCAKRDAKAARLLDYRAIGSFECFKTKTHFNSLKRLVGVTALAASCLPESTRPGGYVTASFRALDASWLLIDWDAIRLPTGITAPR
jgi:hypothetical protein